MPRAIDDGMRWMVDFDAAEKAGMGVRARLTQDLAAGFDFLLVLGIAMTLRRGDRLDAAAGRTLRRAPLHRWAELRAVRHAVQQHA